jgi:hypothetical protein
VIDFASERGTAGIEAPSNIRLRETTRGQHNKLLQVSRDCVSLIKSLYSQVVATRGHLTSIVGSVADTMNKRPLLVTVIGCIFVAAGVIGFAYHLTEFKTQRPFEYSILWICLLRLLAILGGVFVLRGNNWARWLLLVWIAYHVILSAFHPLSELVAHGLLLAVIAYVLFRPQASAYFRSARAEPAQTP